MKLTEESLEKALKLVDEADEICGDAKVQVKGILRTLCGVSEKIDKTLYKIGQKFTCQENNIQLVHDVNGIYFEYPHGIYGNDSYLAYVSKGYTIADLKALLYDAETLRPV